jgi:hypothetical protein
MNNQDLPVRSTLTWDEEETSEKVCDPSTIRLADYYQWASEVGYWIGEYTFLKDDGTPYTSSSWPYRYDSYKGFITGNVRGNAYRQRNVFVYPPQTQAVCDSYSTGDTTVIGSGTCGVNGNTKLFEADQSSTTCDGGNIEGLYAGMFPTKTTLVGNNALLYQVFYDKAIVQSQLTTITEDSSGEANYRTRSAQGFDPMTQRSNSMSYYRERKVSKEVFYEELSHAISAYNVNMEDLCKADPNSTEVGSIEKCINHLENSFLL